MHGRPQYPFDIRTVHSAPRSSRRSAPSIVALWNSVPRPKLAKDYCEQRCRHRNPSQFNPARVTCDDREYGSDSCYEESQIRKCARDQYQRSDHHLHSFPTNARISSPLNLPFSARALAMVSTCDQCSSIRALVRSVIVDKSAEAVSRSPLVIHSAHAETTG